MAGMTRRQLVGFGSLATLSAILAACGQQAPASPTAAPAAAAPTQAPAPTTAPAPTAAPQPTAAPTAAPTTAAAATPAATLPTPTAGSQAAATVLSSVGGTTAQTQSGASLADDSPPQKGGTFRIVSSGDIRGLDPGSAEGSEDWWSAGWVLYNFLYFYDK